MFGTGNNQAFLENQRKKISYNDTSIITTTFKQVLESYQVTRSITLLQAQQLQIEQQNQKCVNYGNITSRDQMQSKQIKQRCFKMKKKNQQLMIAVLNLKERLSRLMYMSHAKNEKNDMEFNQIQQKIRRLKVDISGKIHDLKINNLKNKSEPVEQTNKNSFKFALTELKQGTQLLERETIKAKQQMALVIKYLSIDQR